MSRTIKTVVRPEPHIFDENADLAQDHKGRRFCRCALREDDSVHVSSAELVEGLPPTPVDAKEIDDRKLGEG